MSEKPLTVYFVTTIVDIKNGVTKTVHIIVSR